MSWDHEDRVGPVVDEGTQVVVPRMLDVSRCRFAY